MVNRSRQEDFITWTDVLQLWHDVERESRVRITLAAHIYRRKDGKLVLSGDLTAFPAGSEAGADKISDVGLHYPHVEHRTITSLLVNRLYRLDFQLEDLERRLTAAESQTSI